MKILVLSDTHGRPDRIREAISRQIPPPDVIAFLGDGARDLARCDTGNACVLEVAGNCDAYTFFDAEKAPPERMFSLGGVNILMMHGHMFGVKDGNERAAAHAVRMGADILLYGHTHVKYEEFIPAGESVGGETLKKPLRILNPGSAGAYGDASFGLIEIKNGNILTGFGEL